VILSDTHGLHGTLPPIPNGDIFIHLGDVAERGNLSHIRSFTEWLSEQPHPHKLLISGNHDRDRKHPNKFSLQEEYRDHATLLQDEIIDVEGLRILGVSWETIERNEFPLLHLLEKDDELPVHLLLTHYRSRGMRKLRKKLGIDVHLFGHVHRERGVILAENDHIEINCSTIPFMKAVVIDFDKETGKIVMVHLPDPGHRAAFNESTLYKGKHF
jgi:3',5'-cyclic AMP phosphodiesterase CpdA